MTASFNRPPIIQQEAQTPLPNPSLDQSSTEPDVPSYIVAKILENQLARQLVEGEPVDRANLQSKIACVESWMFSLPPVFSIADPDRRWDEKYPYITFQRLQLQCVGYMTQVILLRRILTLSGIFSAEGFSASLFCNDNIMLVQQVIDLSLKAMSISKETFDLCFPQQAKYYMVAFCPFDNAALLCSLLIHDVDGSAIPRRLEVIRAIGQALHISHHLRAFTKMGDITWSILSALKSRINFYPTERELLEEAESVGKFNITTQTLKSDLDSGDDWFHSINESSDQRSGPSEGMCIVDNTSATDAVEFLEMDLGILDGVWSWERVGF
jgi:hypothetical protein